MIIYHGKNGLFYPFGFAQDKPVFDSPKVIAQMQFPARTNSTEYFDHIEIIS